MSRSKRTLCWSAVLFCLGLSCRAPQPDRPNILLISVDTLRADHLGCYGREEARTPTIDALAESGVVFDAAISAVPITLPSHATMFTGLLPPHHGVRHNAESRLIDAHTTLAERLRTGGYRTGAFLGAGPMDARGGLGQGFEVYDDVPSRPGARPERPAGEVFAAAREWLLGPADGETPVFAFIHVFDPHWPLENALPGASEPSYDGEIAYVDRELGKFLSSLPDTPRWRDALTVLVSDHGEGLGEHGEPSHGLLVYDSTLRVPWIVHRPSSFGPRRVAEPVGLVDLAPTLAELARAGPMPASDGVSLVPVLDGSSPAERELYFESLYGFIDFGWARLRGLRVGSLKYTSAPAPELYDLGSDPGERVNLHGSEADDAARLHRRLQTYDHGDWTRAEMDEEQRARLASLGYVSARPATTTEDATRADPKDKVGVFYRLADAKALIEIGRHAEAFAAFESLDGEFDRSAHFYFEFARAAREIGRWPDVRRLTEQVLALDASHQRARESLVEAQLMTRDPKAALENVRRLLEIDPDHVNAHYLLGSIRLWASGEIDSGVAAWRRLLELDPEHQKAREVRAVLDAYDRGERSQRALRATFVDPR